MHLETVREKLTEKFTNLEHVSLGTMRFNNLQLLASRDRVGPAIFSVEFFTKSEQGRLDGSVSRIEVGVSIAKAKALPLDCATLRSG
jgi:hypothetical protein